MQIRYISRGSVTQSCQWHFCTWHGLIHSDRCRLSSVVDLPARMPANIASIGKAVLCDLRRLLRNIETLELECPRIHKHAAELHESIVDELDVDILVAQQSQHCNSDCCHSDCDRIRFRQKQKIAETTVNPMNEGPSIAEAKSDVCEIIYSFCLARAPSLFAICWGIVWWNGHSKICQTLSHRSWRQIFIWSGHINEKMFLIVSVCVAAEVEDTLPCRGRRSKRWNAAQFRRRTYHLGDKVKTLQNELKDLQQQMKNKVGGRLTQLWLIKAGLSEPRISLRIWGQGTLNY